ncbi:tellurite resistance/C4-dicarboxylate transporter family protein [Ramlibacter monticola]|uniref:Tellurite resistance/C4-dicarboxylate transporter family protein n=1 Tax=Ramlibacter monticola TaxID=1926872 RepID=A0A936Z0J4_9BURK|nr:tellurite resistance/C4-dicarboxylate transporter family protein [Ramlibacter monticola]MBL0392873.1 tellurite resistance/C4-dicarboxylate transporter family protein [Ramlibacter monticola]
MSFVFRPAQGNPSPSFALVMATGILAVAARQQGLDTLAMLLFECAVLAWVLLSLLSLWRLARHRGDVAQDLASLQRAPAFFTAVAGTGVLASGLLVLDGGFAWAAVLALLALVLWTVLTYGVFAAVITSEDKQPLERGIGGAWLLAVVACQSVAVTAALLSSHVGQPWRLQLNFLALGLWLFGGMLYTWIIALIFQRTLFFRFAPADLAPPYWINMGAMAISTLAGAQLVANAAQAPLLEALLPFLKGFTILYWATGTWWLPLLVALTAWRYLLRRDPLRADALDWSMVFPLGMYSAATHNMDAALQLHLLAPLGSVFFGLALLAWVATALLRSSAWVRRVRAAAAA